MSNKFGFSDIARRAKIAERNFLLKGIKLAQEEISENFSSQSSKQSKKSWNELSYRNVPPPILDLTGELKGDALGNKPQIFGNKAVLTIDPIDERGKGYASYHEDGINQYKSKDEFQREFVTHSNELENNQVSTLIKELNNAFL